MVDFNELLRQIQRDGLSGKSLERIKHAVSEGGLGSLGDQVRGMVGDTDKLKASGQDMLDQAKDLLKAGDKRMIGGIGAALGVLMGGGIKGGIGGALMAVLGATAYGAVNKGKSIQEKMANKRESDLPVGMRPPETVAEAEVLERRGVLALKAMLAAAKADGEIDQRERGRILDKLDEAGADEETRKFIAAEAAAPLDVDALVREVPDQESAAQVYAASLLAINVDSEAERAYLRDLSKKLGLDDQTVANLHGVLGVPAIA